MKYKVETLKIGNGKSIDIPEGCIPVKYDCFNERRDPPVSLVITLTILRPSFFCEKNLTRDKVGIRPICAICLGEIYGLIRESHKSQEC